MNWLLINDITRIANLAAWTFNIAICLPGLFRYAISKPRYYDTLRISTIVIGLSFIGFNIAALTFHSTVRGMPNSELSVRALLYVYGVVAAVNRFLTVRAYERDLGNR